jgi:hypothetical protein
VSGGLACREPTHRGRWVVTVRQANYSAFNGGRRTPSDYSEVRCPACPARWRTRAAYVAELPDAKLPDAINLT